MKEETLKVGEDEKPVESETEGKPNLESPTPPVETPEQNVTEPPKEKVEDEQSETTTSDQKPSDTTLPPTAQEGAEQSDPASPSQPSETSGGEETASSAPESSTATAAAATASPDTKKSADTISKTKEIKIARLDVSNVALDTERLELKETSITVCTCLFVYLCLSCSHPRV